MIVLVGKTASGKTLIANEMMKRGYKKIVTTTTRPMRKKEFDGIDYDFISEDDFIEKAKNHYFLELHLIRLQMELGTMALLWKV